MRAAAQATRQFGDEAERASRRASQSFETQRGTSERLEQSLRRLLETQRRQGEESRRQQEQTRRNSDEQQRNRQENDRNSQSQDRLRRSIDQSTRGLTAQRSTLVSMIGAAAAMGAGVTGAGVAFTVFAGLAAPSIGKVVAAQQEMADSWDSLSGQQKASALLVRDLTDEYKNLAKSYEPQALATFNTVISTARGLLPQLGAVVDATSGDVQRLVSRIADFTSARVGGEFLAWAGQTAPRALDLMGDTMVTAGDTALDLLQDIAPLGLGLLQMTNGVLSAANALANVNPLMAQFAVSALLLRAPILGMVGAVGGARDRMRGFSAANRGASLSTKLLHGVMAAGPALYVAAGAALLIYATRAMNAKSATEKFNESLKIETRAFGNNLDGHRNYARQLESNARIIEQRIIAAHNGMSQAVRNSSDPMREQSRIIARLQGQYKETSAELDKQRQVIQRVEAGAALLAGKYGVTRDQALSLATAAGVDLTTALDKTGRLTNQAAAKIDQYRIAVELARDPTRAIALSLESASNQALKMEDRVKALTAAYDAQLTPTLDAFNATTQLREGFRQLGEQMAAAKGRMDGSTEASRQLRQTFAQQINTVRQLHAATLQKTGSMQKANEAVQGYLPILFALSGRNREARATFDALARATGYSASQTSISQQAFVRQATAMLGSKTQALALWQQYQRLTSATNTGTTALGSYISRVQQSASEARNLASRTGAGTSAQSAYNTRVRDALPVLYALAGNNRAARAQVDALARSTGISTDRMNTSRTSFLRAADAMGVSRKRAEALWKELGKIKDRSAKVTIWADGQWSGGPRAIADGPAHLRPTRATGGPIPKSWALGGGGPTEDDVPAWLSVGEHVLTAREVQAAGGHGTVYRLRQAMLRGDFNGFAHGGPIRGYARGGAVALDRDGSTKSVVNDVFRPLDVGYTNLVTSVIRAMAAAWKKLAGSGGGVVSAARSQIGIPYSWGGGGKGGPSLGIGRGAGTVGFDCSGLTEYAWWRGRRVSIGGTTYEQYPRSEPTARRPGALGFPHMGHVVLASNRPGYIIEAPYTGARVREVPSSRGYQWRWPRGAAEGGPITELDRRIGSRFLDASGGPIVVEAKALQVAGDPGGLGIAGYASGGRVTGPVGRDNLLLRATAGEFVINRAAALRSPELVEAINNGRVGQAMIRPTIRASAAVATGGGGAVGRSATGGDVHVHMQNHGVIGSKLELQNWLTRSLDELRRQGRLPVQPR